MNAPSETPFTGFLNRHDQETWSAIIDNLLPSIHEVDRTATRIWFYFWPIWLSRALRESEDLGKLVQQLELKGNCWLEQQVDTSHTFLYGHRYWPRVKRAVMDHAASSSSPESLDLAAQIRDMTAKLAAELAMSESLLLGITAVAFMTLQQVGMQAFAATPGTVSLNRWAVRRSPKKIIRARARNDGLGVFGFFKGLKREFTVTFDENFKGAKFKLISGQELTTASLNDQRDHSPYADGRCMKGQGPIPTECRSAACGTCWVAVLGGRDRLSEVGSLESRRIKRFGYIVSDEPNPIIRLACKAKASGNVTIVIPPWNGVFSRYVEERRVAIGGAAASREEEVAARPRRH
ncbi:MAG: hypothetical protein ACE5HV_04035 [Acidobacteriota bacterium]